jgi:hypothetical protein
LSPRVLEYDPSFSPSGVLWTAPLPEDSALVIDFEAAEATLIVDIDVRDFTKKAISFALGPAVPAALTYELRWSGPIKREASVRDADNGFRGLFKENQATFSWSTSQAGFKFDSDAANTSTSVFAQIGRESNGIFF